MSRAPGKGMGIGLHRCERHIDVFEDGAWSDAAKPWRRFHQVIARKAGVLTAESVDEEQRFGELTSAHQETRAVDGPRIFKLHTSLPLGGGRRVASIWFQVSVLPGSTRNFMRPITRPLGAGSWREVKRLYALAGGGSITKELCNGGIPFRKSDVKYRDQGRMKGNRSVRRRGWVWVKRGELRAEEEQDSGANLHKRRTG